MRGRLKSAFIWGRETPYIRRTWVQLTIAYLLFGIIGILAYKLASHSPYDTFSLGQLFLNFLAMSLIAQLLPVGALIELFTANKGINPPDGIFYTVELGFLFIIFCFWLVRKTIKYPLPKIVLYMLLMIGWRMLGAQFFPYTSMP